MTNLQIAALVYGAVTLVYLIPTYIEGERAGRPMVVPSRSGPDLLPRLAAADTGFSS